ncbi:radical S-adenosyl methionine domain-containing protein 1, mitochondrial-like isoform X2 [Clytia hemisphaerica]|uniref:radical S-adenosyl methionine domain-containing protein 1, mitochondrial-like isoform X2 n=1 Tax=Clytia hemisphaerica TaxID=252671 RepID=UPI0034D40E5B
MRWAAKLVSTFPESFISKRRLLTSLLPRRCLSRDWPFCNKLCPYCDFNKYIRRNINEDEMIGGLQTDLEHFIKDYHIGEVKSVYFGGGTPSLAPPYVVSAILETIHKNAFIADSAEITLEANPTTTEESKLRNFKTEGINRVSIGIQALNNKDLKMLGREHTSEQAISCYKKAMELFGGRVSIDFMFGRPKQSVQDWKKELKQICDLGGNHVSLYQLTMKKHTPMERDHRKGRIFLPKDDALAEMYDLSVQMLDEVGLERYEVSNFAKLGHESYHNSAYWNDMDYIGIGPGAHGRLTSTSSNHTIRNRHEFQQIADPKRWMSQVKKKGHGISINRSLNHQENFEEMVLMGLRTRDGLSCKRLREMSGIAPDELMNIESIQELIDADLLQIDSSSMRVTTKGFSVLDSITREVIFAIEPRKT